MLQKNVLGKSCTIRRGNYEEEKNGAIKRIFFKDHLF